MCWRRWPVADGAGLRATGSPRGARWTSNRLPVPGYDQRASARDRLQIRYPPAIAAGSGVREDRMSSILALFHSQEVGNTEAMAKAVAEGAREADAKVNPANNE
jgi:hypothetical protein